VLAGERDHKYQSDFRYHIDRTCPQRGRQQSYDEPEILPSSNHPVCLKGAAAGRSGPLQARLIEIDTRMLVKPSSWSREVLVRGVINLKLPQRSKLNAHTPIACKVFFVKSDT